MENELKRTLFGIYTNGMILRLLILTLLLSFSTKIYAQKLDMDIVQTLKKDVCECTSRQVNSRIVFLKGNSVLERCLNQKIGTYPEMFKITLANEQFIDSSQPKKAFRINKDKLNAFIAGHQKYFVNHCESYYWYVTALRDYQLKKYRHLKEERLTKLNKQKKKKQKDTLIYLMERAKISMASGSYDEAQSDLKQILKVNSNHDQALFHLAWTYELKGIYIVAKNLYIKLIKKNNNFDAILALECVNRKIIEKYNTTPSLKPEHQNTRIRDSSVVEMEKLGVPPIPRACEGLTDNNKIKQCFSSYIKQRITHLFGKVLESYPNAKRGEHKILVFFKVSKHGFITDIKVKAEDQHFIKEITRIVSSIPPMTPGILNGEKIGVLYSLPIHFRL